MPAAPDRIVERSRPPVRGRGVAVLGILGGAAMFLAGVVAAVLSRSLVDAALLGAVGLLGLVSVWFHAATWPPSPGPRLRLGAPEVRPGLPLLPRRRLALALPPGTRGTLGAAIAFFGIVAALFSVLAASRWPEGGLGMLDAWTAASIVFCAVLAALGALFAAATARALARKRRGVARPIDAWAEVVRFDARPAEDADGADRVLVYRSPFAAGALVELPIDFDEELPWIVEGHVLVVRDENVPTEHVMRVDGGPFELRAAELARLARA